MREKILGLTLVGEFDDEFSNLDATVFTPGGSATIVFTPMSPERLAASPGLTVVPPRRPGENAYRGLTPQAIDDGRCTAPPSQFGLNIGPLAELVGAVSNDQLPMTYSVLVARSGYLVFEEYFYGFDRDLLHDMRSASKSLASALLGLAVDRRLIENADARVLPFFPEYRSYGAWDSHKARISLRHLMTLSSGLDADDVDPNSVAAEGVYLAQSRQPDWIKLALDAPMVADPGTQLVYGSANALVWVGCSLTSLTIGWNGLPRTACSDHSTSIATGSPRIRLVFPIWGAACTCGRETC